jgi:hypothetical protein
MDKELSLVTCYLFIAFHHKRRLIDDHPTVEGVNLFKSVR